MHRDKSIESNHKSEKSNEDKFIWSPYLNYSTWCSWNAQIFALFYNRPGMKNCCCCFKPNELPMIHLWHPGEVFAVHGIKVTNPTVFYFGYQGMMKSAWRSSVNYDWTNTGIDGKIATNFYMRTTDFETPKFQIWLNKYRNRMKNCQ